MSSSSMMKSDRTATTTAAAAAATTTAAATGSNHTSSSTAIRILAPQQLQDKLNNDDATTVGSSSPLWKYLLTQRLGSSSSSASNDDDSRIWTIATTTTYGTNATTSGTCNPEKIHCIANVDWAEDRIYLFCRDDPSSSSSNNSTDTDTDKDNNDSVTACHQILQHAVGILIEKQQQRQQQQPPATTGEIRIRFSALDRKWLPIVRTFLEDRYGKMLHSWEYPCGFWISHNNIINNNPQLVLSSLPSNADIRKLTQDDAELINSRWEYKSDTSLDMVRKMIATGDCWGLELPQQQKVKGDDNNDDHDDDNTNKHNSTMVLVSWVCRYLEGPLGMLWTEKEYRQKGYGAHVLLRATTTSTAAAAEDHHQQQEQLLWTSFILDDNIASQNLFRKLGWKRVCDADWVGFTLQCT